MSLGYLYDRCGRKSNSFHRGWGTVWSCCGRGGRDCGRLPVVGTVGSVSSSCTDRQQKYWNSSLGGGGFQNAAHIHFSTPYPFWLPWTFHSYQRSHPPSSSLLLLRLHHPRHRWTTTLLPRLKTVHLCDIWERNFYYSSETRIRTSPFWTQLIDAWPSRKLTCWVSDSGGLFPARIALWDPWKSEHTRWIQVLCRSYPQCVR